MPTAVHTGGSPVRSPYRLKPSAYSSHSLILAGLPAGGEGRRVLDVGCADGYLGDLLARRGYQVTGIEHAARVGTAFPETIDLVTSDLDHGLPAGLGTFDVIVCADVLEHLRRPEELLRAFHTVLAPGGCLVASLPNSGHLYFRWTVLCGRFPRYDRGLFDRTHLHFYTWDGWVDLFAAAGFAIERFRGSAVPFGEAWPAWQGRWPVRVAEYMAFELARVWKTACAYQFVVAALPLEEG